MASAMRISARLSKYQQRLWWDEIQPHIFQIVQQFCESAFKAKVQGLALPSNPSPTGSWVI